MNGEKFSPFIFIFRYFCYICVVKIINVFVNFDLFIGNEQNSIEPYPESDGIIRYNTGYCFGPESGNSRRIYLRLYN